MNRIDLVARAVWNRVKIASRKFSCFVVKDSTDKGKILVATKDMLPGHLVFKEQPLLTTTNKLADNKLWRELKITHSIDEIEWELHAQFLQASVEVQQKLLGLHCPMHSRKAVSLRDNVQSYAKLNNWTEEQIDNFVRVGVIFDKTGFNCDGENGSIYFTPARLSHSCLPNCTVTQNVDYNAVGTIIMPVKKGEELTINYVTRALLSPTHVRRAAYQQQHDFLCECPRCTALGDDTRQFDCCDKTCSGRHYACQPISDAVPYLLPCNVCHQLPSKENEKEMFEWEVLAELDSFEGTMSELRTFIDHSPRHHMATFSTRQLYCEEALRDGTVRKDDLLQVTKLLIAPFEHSTPFPCSVKHDIYSLAVWCFLNTESAEGLLLAKSCCQIAMQTGLIINGRHHINRNETLDKQMSHILSQLPPQAPSLTECMFCGSSPHTSAISLQTVCEDCRQVVYCSEECRDLHKAVHKRSCIKI